MKELFRLGIEKVSLNTAAHAEPGLIRAAAETFGRQSVVVSIDVRKRLFGGYDVVVEGGRRSAARDPTDYARQMEAAGAGELLLNSVDRDGTRAGYDLDLIGKVSEAVGVPVVACGGADSSADFRAALDRGAAACAAGSMFVFQRGTGAVLISYAGLS
jgi:cyclase